MKISILAILFAVAAVSGCTSLGQVDATTKVAEGETVFLLGVAPENYRVSVFPGSIKGNFFLQSLIRPAAVYGGPKNGFVVGKARVGEVLGITMVSVHDSATSVLGAQFKPCGGSKTMVFQVPAGKVIYLGHLAYEFDGRSLNVKYSKDLEAAQRYAAENLPALTSPVQQADYQLLESGALSCPQGTIAPVYR